MTHTSVKVIKDSISYAGIRITTILCEYPRIIHSEVMTHRMFSRNASSSRAIPVTKLIEQVKERPFIPDYWGKNQSGMQAKEELDSINKTFAQDEWLYALNNALHAANNLKNYGAHKQLVNRILEPFSYIKVLITSTNYNNFLALRDHEDAQPEIRELAVCIKKALANSKPKELDYGEWHLPFIEEENDFDKIRQHLNISKKDRGINFGKILDLAKDISASRCATLSYGNADGSSSTFEKDLARISKLRGSPLHASPFEHQATQDKLEYVPFLTNEEIEKKTNLSKEGISYTMKYGFKKVWEKPELHGNLTGYIQYRKLLPNEYVS